MKANHGRFEGGPGPGQDTEPEALGRLPTDIGQFAKGILQTQHRVSVYVPVEPCPPVSRMVGESPWTSARGRSASLVITSCAMRSPCRTG